MSYWASGFFDEDGQYILPKTWRELPKDFQLDSKTKESTLTADVNLEFFENHINKAEHKSREFFDWNRMKSYAKLALDFYWQTLAAFNKNYIKDKITNLPQKFEGWQNLESIASRFDEAEANLINQFSRTNRDLNVQIEKIKNLRSAVNYGSMAWMMYHLMFDHLINPQVKIDLSNIISSSLSIAEKNPTTDEEKLDYYNNLAQFRREGGVKVKPNFLCKKHGYVYVGIDSTQILDNVLVSSGGLTLKLAEEKLNEIYKSKNEYFSTDVGNLLNFYNNRWLILANAKTLENCSDQWEEGIVKNLNLFAKTHNGKDIFEQVEQDRQELLDLYYFAENKFDKHILDDIVDVGRKLAKSLKYAQQSYSEYLREMDDAEHLLEMLKAGSKI